jgi:GTP-binding protein LepA
MMNLCAKYRGVQNEYKVLEGTNRAILRYSLPLSGELAAARPPS